MDLKESVPFSGLPREMHQREIPEALVDIAGFVKGQDTSKMNLAHVAITASRSDGKWYVYVLDPRNSSPDQKDILGSFTMDDVPPIEADASGISDETAEGIRLTGDDILDEAESWLRDSDFTEWVPREVIKVHDQLNADTALGHLLIRAPQPTRV